MYSALCLAASTASFLPCSWYLRMSLWLMLPIRMELTPLVSMTEIMLSIMVKSCRVMSRFLPMRKSIPRSLQ